MKKFEQILDHEGNILITSDEVARAVSHYQDGLREPTGNAFKAEDGAIYEVYGLDLDRDLCIVSDRKHDLSTGGT